MSLAGGPHDPWGHPRPWKCPQGVPGPLRTSPPWMPPPRAGDPLGQNGSPQSHPGIPSTPNPVGNTGGHRRHPSIPPTRAAESGEWARRPLENPMNGVQVPCLGAATQVPTGVGGPPQNQSRGGGLDPPSTPQSRRRAGAFTDFNLVLFLETKKNNPKKEKIK